MKKYNFYLLILMIALVACTKIELNGSQTDKAVLQGYLYANQPITEIQITRIIPKETEENLSLPITDAQVYVSTEGKKYELTHNPRKQGFYEYKGTDLKVVTGKKYEIEFQYFGRTTTAETVVPSAPKSVNMTPKIIYVSRITGFMDLINAGSVEDMNLTWNNTNQDYYYMVITNLETNPVKIIDDNAFPNRPVGNFNFISSPTRADNFTIRFQQLEQFGKHRIRLFKVNKEYADLYDSQQQDSRNLNEPITNVKNGLGVFTAFNMDSVFFEVRRK
ncbi:MAG: DUF4249 domain-containing protein [Thermoflexibacter sp.]|jgi:hypothetical protein|nr:DUF4249 domain-containing protein [Thermoflexibacter sp.]